jgi:hypothetical protein
LLFASESSHEEGISRLAALWVPLDDGAQSFVGGDQFTSVIPDLSDVELRTGREFRVSVVPDVLCKPIQRQIQMASKFVTYC